MKEEEIENFFLPLVYKLSEGERFTTRSSSCGLFIDVYPTSTKDDKTKLLK
jgi:hypothetical protein